MGFGAAVVVAAFAGWFLSLVPVSRTTAKNIATWVQVGTAAICVLTAVIIVYTDIFTGL